ncbi:hypothetical protein EVC24_055 [Rhizobium phage RHph_I4]|nr:hypothetical protein EVC24_055 [Rhizobium phage RHph_I4]
MKKSHKPARGSQQERLLIGLLHGDIIDPIKAINEYNVLIPSARVAELRRMGWPIRSIEMPHPSGKFIGQNLTAYTLDNHFRRWYGDPANLGKHPANYPGKDGRGKFENWSQDDFERGERA